MDDMTKRLKDISKLSASEISKIVSNKNYVKEPYTQKSENKALNDLSPEMRTIFAEEKIRSSVKQFGEINNGLTVDEIAKLTGYSYKTVAKHLNTLTKLREVYSITKGKRMTLYFPNGKPLWDVGRQRFEWGSNIIEATLARGPEKKLFFHILEKRYSILEGEKAEGGILIPIEGFDDFIKGLKKLKENVEVKE